MGESGLAVHGGTPERQGEEGKLAAAWRSCGLRGVMLTALQPLGTVPWEGGRVTLPC